MNLVVCCNVDVADGRSEVERSWAQTEVRLVAAEVRSEVTTTRRRETDHDGLSRGLACVFSQSFRAVGAGLGPCDTRRARVVCVLSERGRRSARARVPVGRVEFGRVPQRSGPADAHTRPRGRARRRLARARRRGRLDRHGHGRRLARTRRWGRDDRRSRGPSLTQAGRGRRHVEERREWEGRGEASSNSAPAYSKRGVKYR